jgi:hypothetical protein
MQDQYQGKGIGQHPRRVKGDVELNCRDKEKVASPVSSDLVCEPKPGVEMHCPQQEACKEHNDHGMVCQIDVKEWKIIAKDGQNATASS